MDFFLWISFSMVLHLLNLFLSKHQLIIIFHFFIFYYRFPLQLQILLMEKFECENMRKKRKFDYYYFFFFLSHKYHHKLYQIFDFGRNAKVLVWVVDSVVDNTSTVHVDIDFWNLMFPKCSHSIIIDFEKLDLLAMCARVGFDKVNKIWFIKIF